MDDHTLIERLAQWGCDTRGALARTLDDEEFYVSLIRQYVEMAEARRLPSLIAAGDASAAFDVAHDIKGVSSNLGLTPIYNASLRVVEPLRVGRCDGLDADLDALLVQEETLEKLING